MRVLRERANAKSRKQQALHDVVTPDVDVDAADAEHARIGAAVAALHKSAQACMPSLEARTLLACAWCARERETDTGPARPCAITLAQTERVVRLFDSQARATEHACEDASDAEWLKWIEAAMVVGGVVNWLDEQAAAWLDHADAVLHPQTRQCTPATVAALASNAHLHAKRTAFEAACRVFVHRLA
ncbi:MAG: hypothetical protein Q7V62_08185 [Actinomycetota bacterium]|nr:hypothetical protein [Actinomycetota bacterium]